MVLNYICFSSQQVADPVSALAASQSFFSQIMKYNLYTISMTEYGTLFLAEILHLRKHITH